MRDPNRIEELIVDLRNLWKKKPDLRLGQLLVNLSANKDLFYLEDEDLLAQIRKAQKE